MEYSVYFAAVFVSQPGRPENEKVFKLVRCSTPGSLPYLTLSSKGLRSTAHHANLYRLTDDGKHAALAEFRCPAAGTAGRIRLTDQQAEDVQKAIKAGMFYP